MTATALEGKTAEVLFETGYHFKLEYLPENKLKWTSLREVDKGNNETENIYVHEISNGIFNVNWIESTGTSVTHLININEGSVWAYMSWPNDAKYGNREVLTHKGTFHFIKTDGTPDTTPFTNQQKALDFWDRFFNQHDGSAVDDYLAAPYLQHNPYVPDGVAPFKDYFMNAFQNELKDHHSEVKAVASTEDRVYIHNFVTNGPTDRGTAAMDIFRFENGKIVEHWDVLQPMPETAANDHPMF